MKAEELMVGDWVRFPIGNDKICDLPYVEGKGICASFSASATLFPVSVEQLEPIPLTPEILEKNGFNYVKETGYMCYEQLGDRQYNLIAVKGNILQMQFTSGNLVWTECRYVHELQHCLKLVGIEKDIVL